MIWIKTEDELSIDDADGTGTISDQAIEDIITGIKNGAECKVTQDKVYPTLIYYSKTSFPLLCLFSCSSIAAQTVSHTN